jgi:hypothetical protein
MVENVNPLQTRASMRVVQDSEYDSDEEYDRGIHFKQQHTQY